MTFMTGNIINDLAQEAASARTRHAARFGDAPARLAVEIRNRFGDELDQVLAFLINDRALVAITDPVHKILRQELCILASTGSDLCDLAPPLGLQPTEDFSLALVVYAASRLAHDAMCAGPIIAEDQPPGSLIGTLLALGQGPREAGALAVMLCLAVINAAIGRLNSRGRRQIAETMLRLSMNVFAGIMAEVYPPHPLPPALSSTIFERRWIALHMIPAQVLLQDAPAPIRGQLLAIHAGLIEVQAMKEKLPHRMAVLLEQIKALPESLQDPLLMRLGNCVAPVSSGEAHGTR